MHWATQYVGMPYRKYADGPDTYDCWNFFRMVQRAHFSTEVPQVGDTASLYSVIKAFETDPEREMWRPVVKPIEGDAVLMGRNSRVAHIGTWIEPGAVLHCVEKSGVLVQKIVDLHLCGWGHINYYRRVR